MKVGSLLQCVIKSKGIYKVNGSWVRLLPDIEVGTIVLCDGVQNGQYEGKIMPGVLIAEDGGAKHPSNGLILLRNPNEFKEVQPPIVVDIESLIEQPLEHA